MNKLLKTRLKAVGIYCLAVFSCLILLIWILKLWEADLKIPFGYSGDLLTNGMLVKGMIDNGWYLNNYFVGMPMGLHMQDYPMADNFHFMIMKIISLFSSNWVVTVNLYFLLTFPLATITSLITLRQFKISYPVSVVISLLFTFLPYHFFRGTAHLYLASYYMIPLIVMVILWCFRENQMLIRNDETSGKKKLDLRSPKLIISVLISLLAASTGVYYAFFAVFFLVLTGLIGYINKRTFQPLLISGVLAAIISLGLLINISPSLIYKYKYGINQEVGERGFNESEIYGLKITQMLLPVPGHRISALSDIAYKYINLAPLVTENHTAALGITGSIGFVVLLGLLFYNASVDELSLLSLLNISAVLLGTIGGFGTVFAMTVSPQIRAYNRISVYIAFFSLFAVAILLQRIKIKYLKTGLVKAWFYILLVLILSVGILDQTTESFSIDNAQIKEEFENDRNFISKVEAILPQNSRVFQMPYVPFPENPPVNKMGDYELFKAYLHSRTLRWSYGTMKGREGDVWQKQVSGMPADNMVKQLSTAGFNGIYIDRYGYTDMAAGIEEKLVEILGTKPIISTNNRLAFFDMHNYNK